MSVDRGWPKEVFLSPAKFLPRTHSDFTNLLPKVGILHLAEWFKDPDLSGSPRVNVIVSKGCHDKVPQTDGLKQTQCILSCFWRLEV